MNTRLILILIALALFLAIVQHGIDIKFGPRDDPDLEIGFGEGY